MTSPPTKRLHRRLRSASNRRRLTALALAAVLVVTAAAAVASPAVAQSDTDPFALDTEAVESVTNATVSGTTTLDAGTEIQVRLSSTGETSPQFLKTKTTTVGSDGVWNATFDLSAIETHDTVGVSVVVTNESDDRSAGFEVPIENDRATPTDSGGSLASAPGFGIGTAVAGLLGSAALLRRRD
jgi:PGF-CTERM protein